MSMNLTDTRLFLREVGRNAGDPSYYRNSQLDASLLALCGDFLDVTRYVIISTSIAFVASTNTADFSALGGFAANRIKNARVNLDANYTDVGADLSKLDDDAILNFLMYPQRAAEHGFCSSGTPQAYGFIDKVTAKFLPAPAHDGTITVKHWPLQTSFTIGTRGPWASGIAYAVSDVVSSAGSTFRSLVPNNIAALTDTASWDNLGVNTLVAPASIVSTIPDGILLQLLRVGGPAYLQSLDPEHNQALLGEWANYKEFRTSHMGAGSISGNITLRSSGHSRRR